MARRATVLLVEDDEHDVELMKLAFAKAKSPFALLSVVHGGEAIRYLSGTGPYGDREKYPLPFLILLDLKMPLVDGFEVLRWLQQQPSVDRTPVLVMSHSKMEEDQRRAQNLGAVLFAIKPLEFQGAVEFVRRLADFQRPVRPE